MIHTCCSSPFYSALNAGTMSEQPFTAWERKHFDLRRWLGKWLKRGTGGWSLSCLITVYGGNWATDSFDRNIPGFRVTGHFTEITDARFHCELFWLWWCNRLAGQLHRTCRPCWRGLVTGWEVEGTRSAHESWSVSCCLCTVPCARSCDRLPASVRPVSLGAVAGVSALAKWTKRDLLGCRAVVCSGFGKQGVGHYLFITFL